MTDHCPRLNPYSNARPASYHKPHFDRPRLPGLDLDTLHLHAGIQSDRSEILPTALPGEDKSQTKYFGRDAA